MRAVFMQAFTIVVVVWCLSAADAAPASTSHDIGRDGLQPLPTDVLREIGSRLPVMDRLFFSSASHHLRTVIDSHGADIVSERLSRRFGKEDCLIAALHLEAAPPGSIVEVVGNLLRSTQFKDSDVRKALRQAYAVGHCDIVDVLSGHLQTSSSNASANFDRASCANVARLASLPLAELLRMHALPRATFLQVLAAKYHDSGYDSFFHDPAWYSQRCSNSIMSHALHLCEKLNGTVDFEPVPFGQIASGTMSEPTQKALLHFFSVGSTLGRISLRKYLHIFYYLQLVLSPGSRYMKVFMAFIRPLRTAVLKEACITGRLDRIKFMVNHELWSDITVPVSHLFFLGSGYYSDQVLRYVDVLMFDDPFLSAFKMVFHHQMNQLSSSTREHLSHLLLASSISDSAKKIVAGYTSATDAELNE